MNLPRLTLVTLSLGLLLAACGRPPTEPTTKPNAPTTLTPLSLQLYIGNREGENLPVPIADQAPQTAPLLRPQGFPASGDVSFSQATYTMRVFTNPERWTMTAAFRVTNNTDTALANLALIARTRDGQTIGRTSLSSIRAQNGSLITDPAVARGFEPINTVRTYDDAVIESAADFQAYRLQDAAQIETAAVAAGVLTTSHDLLNYGFVARRSDTSRTIPARTCKTSPQDRCNVGTVSITFKTPAIFVNGSVPSLPLRLTFESLLTTEATTRVTRSEETTANAVQRAQNLGAQEVALVGSDTDTAPAGFTTVRVPSIRRWSPDASVSTKAVIYAPILLATVGSRFDFDGTGSNTPNANYAWNFGDGTTSSAVRPSHSYTSPGRYTVRLTVTDAQGISDEATVSVSVLPKLENIASNVTLRGGLKGSDTVNFDLGDPLEGFSYSWDFGDGTTGTGSRVAKSYPVLGTYVVKIKVVDNRPVTTQRAGQVRPQALGDTVYEDETWITRWEPAPKASFKLSTAAGEGVPFGIAPLPMSFDATASSGSSGLTYAWTFGTSGTATGSQVNHTFPEGEHTVTLTVTDAKGQKDTYRAYVVAKNENMYSRIAFDYPTFTTASARFAEENLSDGRVNAPRGGPAPARVRTQDIQNYTDHFPYVLHNSAMGRTATTRWNAFSNGGNYRNVFCNQVNVFYNQVPLSSFFLAQNTAFPDFCEFASIRKFEFPPLQARGNSEYYITSSLWNQALQFDTFSGLRVPRVVMAVVPDSAIPGEKPSPFVSENTASVNGSSELLLTVRFRESEVVNGYAEFEVPVYAVNDAGNLVTTANGYFRGSFVSSSTNFTTSCDDCVMVNGKAHVKVRVFVPAFKITGEKLDLSTFKLFANPSCGNDNSPWAGKVRDFALVFGCTTLTTSPAIPSGAEPLEPFAYPIPAVTASFRGHVVTGATAEAINRFQAQMQEGLWPETRDYVLGFIPFAGSGNDLLATLRACRPQCDAVALVLAGAGVVFDVVPAVGDTFKPVLKAYKASRLGARRGLASGIEAVINDGLDAARTYDGLKADLDGVFKTGFETIESCGSTCAQQADGIVKGLTVDGVTPKGALQSLDAGLSTVKASGGQPFTYLRTLEALSTLPCPVVPQRVGVRPQAFDPACVKRVKEFMDRSTDFIQQARNLPVGDPNRVNFGVDEYNDELLRLCCGLQTTGSERLIRTAPSDVRDMRGRFAVTLNANKASRQGLTVLEVEANDIPTSAGLIQPDAISRVDRVDSSVPNVDFVVDEVKSGFGAIDAAQFSKLVNGVGELCPRIPGCASGAKVGARLVVYSFTGIVNTLDDAIPLIDQQGISRSTCLAGEAANVFINFVVRGNNGFTQYVKVPCDRLSPP
jgi:PKD repeat protein